jgi:lysophospholipase L1-like esterase
VSNLRLVYCNRYSLGSGIGELDFINGGTQAAYQLEASIASGSVVSPATFRGALRPTLDSGASLTVSDPIGAIVAAGATLQVRTGAIVSAGGSVPATLPTVSNFSKAKSAAGSSQVYTASAFATPGGGSVSTYGVAPVAVLGIPDQRHVSVFAWGDSITYGLSDGTGSAAGSYGWLERGLESVNGTTIPSVNCSRHGETSIVYVDGTSIARTALMEYATHAVFGHGSNNIALGGALPTVQGHCQAIWAQARRMGLKVYHMTLIPRTTSTDAWATAANQTPASGFAAGDKRDQFNSWLRAQAAASVIDGVIDVAAMVEDSANPGKWRTDAGALTGDGIHPNSAGHALMAAALNAAAAGWSV